MFHSRDGMISLSLSDGEEVCRSFLLKNTMYADIDQDGTVDRIQLSSDEDEEGESLDARTQVFKYDGIGLVSNKCSIVLNSNSKYLVTRKHDKVVIGKL